MLDSETVIRFPHSGTVTRKNGKTIRKTIDPRTSVTIKDHGCELVLFFEGDDLSGKAPLLEVSVRPDHGTLLKAHALMPRLPLYLTYARAAMAGRQEDAGKSLKALREAGKGRRGLSDDFYKLVIQSYTSIVAEGELFPVKALADLHGVKISTASRWITEARRRFPKEMQHAS